MDGANPSRRAPLLAGIVVGLLLVAIAMLAVGGPVALMHRQTATLEEFYGDTMVNVVSRVLARQTPRAGDPEAGRTLYLTGCAQCHGAAGDGKGVYGFNAHPATADLTSSRTKTKSDAQLLWIIRNGVSFSAMPSFGRQYDDDQLAALVTYVHQLQSNAA